MLRSLSWSTLLLCAVFVSAHAENAAVTSLRSDAQRYFREGSYDQAANAYRRMATLDPNNADVLKESMWGFWNIQRFEEAEQMAHRVLEIHYNDQEAKNIVSWAPRAANREKIIALRDKALKNYQAGQYSRAADLYKELNGLNPDDPATLKDWMWALWSAQRHQEAGDVARKIQTLQPQDTASQEILAKLPALLTQKKLLETAASANAAQSRSDYESAAKLYQQLAQMKPQDPAPLRSLAWAYFRMGRYATAKETAMELTQKFPEDATSWSILGRMHMALDDLESSLTAYEESLRLNPSDGNVMVELGKLYIRQRNLDKGIALLEKARQSNAAAGTLEPLLAKALFYKGEYDRSAEMWMQAAQGTERTHFEYRFYEAQARYYAGQPRGLAMMQELHSVYNDARATNFLISEALARGDRPAAEALRESAIPQVRSDNEASVQQLISLYLLSGKTDKALTWINKLLEENPKHSRAMILKGKIYQERQVYDKAVQYYREALAINPHASAARLNLAEAEFQLGHYDKSLEEMGILRGEDPTDPYYLLREARYLHENGQPEKARAQLLEWANKHGKGPMLPVLLYHGLTPRKNDPILGESIHYRLDVFEDHMRAIAQQHYTAVTVQDVADWIAGKRELPEKPILISFDDGRIDSLLYADPILKKYKLKATMFAAMANIEGVRPIGYASWPQLLSYYSNGRWDIQSHGDQAHVAVPIDDERFGIYIANRAWKSEEKRFETVEEWRKRVGDDHESSKRQIFKATGKTPIGYAYAEGEYGQNLTNFPDAAPENLKLAREHFAVSFVQDNYGINTRDRDPARLVRIEPPQHIGGEDLLQQLRDQNPVVFIYQELLHEGIWKGRVREADQWVSKLKELNVSERLIWAEQARIRYAAGDYQEGFSLASRVLSYSPDHYERMIGSHLAKEGPAWNPGFVYSYDNRERRSYIFDQRFQFLPSGNTNWYVSHRYGLFKETGLDTTRDNAGGVGVQFKPGLFHSASVDVMGHALSGTARNHLTGNADLESQWSDNWKTRLEAGHEIHHTARALQANISQTYGNGLVEWSDLWNWTLRGRARYYFLSDDNRRVIIQPEISRNIDSRGTLRIVYRCTYDNAKFNSESYYAPRQLLLNEIGPEFSSWVTQRIRFFIRYRPGYGTEKGVGGQFVQQGQAECQIALSDRTWIMPTFSMEKTPTYRQTSIGLLFRHHFGQLRNMGVQIIKEDTP